MKAKQIFLIVVAIILVGFFVTSLRGLKIDHVIDGQTVKLNNGALISLIGIEPTDEAAQYLKNLEGTKVVVVPDGSQFFNIKNMEKGAKYPAYLNLKKGGNINGKILIEGRSRLSETAPLRDSLDNFRYLAQNAPKNVPEPQITPRVIDYEDDDLELPAPPPPVKPGERKSTSWFVDGNMNLDMLEDVCDYNLPYTKSFANQLAAKSPGNFNIGQVCEIFDYCYNKWRYVNDPADREYVARASESISASLTGDCDDFAVLLASCILSVGGRPCINLGINPGGGHAFTEVDISNWDENEVLSEIKKHFSAYPISSINTRRDGKHLWLNLDWQASYPGGKYYDCSTSHDVYPYINGQWTWEKLN